MVERVLSRSIWVGNIRSIEDAATEMDHGWTFCTRDGSGSSLSLLPAENTTVIPSCMAWNEPIAAFDAKKGRKGGL